MHFKNIWSILTSLNPLQKWYRYQMPVLLNNYNIEKRATLKRFQWSSMLLWCYIQKNIVSMLLFLLVMMTYAKIAFVL